jgi:hypothetical protein
VVLTAEATPKEPPPLTVARLSFRKLLTALRLLKPGAAALASTAWWRVDESPWQSFQLRFSGRPQGGEYLLEAEDRNDLLELFELIRDRPLPPGALQWALSRFEMGCEQGLPLDGLSDHLLALRALLDGEEPEAAVVPARLAALCAEPAERLDLRARVNQALRLQALLMQGELEGDHLRAAGWESADLIALEIEHCLRAVLRDVVCGYLEPDVKRVADDLLAGDDDVGQPVPEKPAHEKPRRAPKTEPVVERWDEIEQAATPPEPDGDDVPEIQVTRAKPKSTAKSKPKAKPKRKAAPPNDRSPKQEHSRASEASEQETKETVAVGAFGESWGDESLDWGFDDDPSDFSAAV